MWALRRWLMCLLAYDRAEGCWVLMFRNDTGEHLSGGGDNRDLTDPRAATTAQQWAAQFLQRRSPEWHDQPCDDQGAPYPIRLCDEPACPAQLPPLQPTEWRTVWHAGLRGYAPLFAGTQPCHIPVSDLDPATGANCFCVRTGQGDQHG